jgi:hypothetical protein
VVFCFRNKAFFANQSASINLQQSICGNLRNLWLKKQPSGGIWRAEQEKKQMGPAFERSGYYIRALQAFIKIVQREQFLIPLNCRGIFLSGFMFSNITTKIKIKKPESQLNISKKAINNILSEIIRCLFGG